MIKEIIDNPIFQSFCAELGKFAIKKFEEMTLKRKKVGIKPTWCIQSPDFVHT